MAEFGQVEIRDPNGSEGILTSQDDDGDDHEVILGGGRPHSDSNEVEDDARSESDNDYINLGQGDP